MFFFFLFHKLSLENMDRIFLEIKQNSFLSPPPPPFFFVSPPPPPTNLDSSGFDLNNKVSPSLLLIIVILAIIFFLSGLLHLLVRFLLRPPNRNPDDFDSVSALQGQLQQLFHLHDSGVDQSFIDTLPVFHYKAIIGLKDPFDCAVCLCEFECEDKLRLLPKCSHAFHMECIDTWLLSHSTCPLCRACLLSDFSQNNSRTPYVLVLESGSESSREIIPDRESSAFGVPNSVARTSSHLGCCTDDELGSSRIDLSRKSCEIHVKDDVGAAAVVGSGEKVVQVKLGKFKNVDGNGGGEGSTSNGDGGDNNAEARRCFSMGSFEYVMDENSSLQVPIRTPMKKKNQSSKKPSLPLTPGHRQAMSECDCDSRREFNGFDPFKGLADIHGGCSSSSISNSGNVIGRSKRESFSVSKIWMRATKKEKDHNSPSENSSSRRAFSFRFPVQKNASGCVAAADDDDLKMKNNDGRRSISEIGMVGNWEVNGNGNGNELGGGGFDVENQSCNSSNLTDSQAKTPSFARRTLHWLVGRQNKVVHSSFGPADV